MFPPKCGVNSAHGKFPSSVLPDQRFIRAFIGEGRLSVLGGRDIFLNRNSLIPSIPVAAPFGDKICHFRVGFTPQSERHSDVTPLYHPCTNSTKYSSH